jgi:DNA polymerase-4
MARGRADRAVDVIRERFGRDAVHYASSALSAARSAPDEFRSLAEKQL